MYVNVCIFILHIYICLMNIYIHWDWIGSAYVFNNNILFDNKFKGQERKMDERWHLFKYLLIQHGREKYFSCNNNYCGIRDLCRLFSFFSFNNLFVHFCKILILIKYLKPQTQCKIHVLSKIATENNTEHLYSVYT